MGGVFRLDDLLQEDRPFKLDDLLGKSPLTVPQGLPKQPTITDIAQLRPMARDVTAQRDAPDPIPIAERGPIRRGFATGIEFGVEALGESMRAAGRSIRKKAGAIGDIRQFMKGGQLVPTPMAPMAGPRPVVPATEPDAPLADWLEQQGDLLAVGARESAAEIPGPGKRLTEIRSLDDAVNWAAFTVSQGVASSLPSLAGGVVGGLVGGPAGAIAGAMGPGYILNQQEVRRALLEEGIDEDTAERISGIAAVPMAMLDVIVPARIGTKMTAPLRRQMTRSVVRRFLQETGTTGALEGVTEFGQATIERVTTAGTTGKPLTKEDLVQVLEEGVAGGLTGMFLGGAGQAVAEVRGAAQAPTEAAPAPPPKPVAEETKFSLDDLLGPDEVIQVEGEARQFVDPETGTIRGRGREQRPEELEALRRRAGEEAPGLVSEKPPQVSDIPPRDITPETIAPERVKVAAIRTGDGQVFEAPIHVLAIEDARAAGAIAPGRMDFERGFTTNKGRFVLQEEAEQLGKTKAFDMERLDDPRVTTEQRAAFLRRAEPPVERVTPQEPAPSQTASLAKAEGAAIRERLGLEELPPAARQSFQSAWDEAKGRNLAEQATDVAQEAAASKRPLTPTEHAGAVQRYLELERDLTDVRSTLADAVRDGNDKITQQLSIRSERILDEIDALTEATDRTGSEAGRALSIRRLRANVETFTLASGLQMARSRKRGSLTPGEIGEIEKLTEQVSTLEEQNTQLRTENDELEQKRQQAVAEQVVRVEARRTRVDTARLQGERQAILKQLADLGVRLNDISGVSAEGSYLIGKLAANHIRAAVTRTGERVELNRIVDEVLAELNNPEIRPRDIHEALNARDPKRQQRQQSEVTRQIRRLKSHARLLTQVEDAEAGIFAPGRSQPARPAEIRALQKRLTELRNSAYRAGLRPERLERAIATLNELQDQLTNHFRNIKRRQPVEVTPELEAIQAKIRGLRQEMRVEDLLADLNEQLRTGDFKTPKRRVAPHISPQLERNQIALKRAQRKWRDAIERMAPLTRRRAIGETAGFLRTMKATADMSATLRQGLWLSPRRPVKAAKAFAEAVKGFFSEYTTDQIDNAIRQHPNQFFRDRAKLELTERGGRLSGREEHFQSSVAERLPLGVGAVVRASERHMTTDLNLLRVAAFDQFLELYPNATTDELRAWADVVNISSGRGSLGRLAPVANELSLGIFAPRFAVSRIQTPSMIFKYWHLPRVRKEIAKDQVAVVGLGLTVLGLAALAGASVGLDPRDPDFGKIRIGNTRIDIWGGVQQPARVIARIMLGLTDRTGLTGRHLTKSEKEINPLEILGRFAAFKIAPLVSIPLELIRGRTAVGEEVTPSETAVRSILPMVFEDIYEASQEGWPRAVLAGTGAFLGLGASTYGDRELARGGPRAPRRPQPPRLPLRR